jgi:hypothetical protein
MCRASLADEDIEPLLAMLVSGVSPQEVATRAWCEVLLWLRAKAVIDEHAHLRRLHERDSARIVSLRI